MKKVFIIAEAGINHNGSYTLAKELIDIATKSGADAVKFQIYKTENYVSINASQANYQKRNGNPNESQFHLIKKYELSYHDHYRLSKYCKKKGIIYLATAFDLESLNFLVNKIRVKYLKIPSGEINNGLLLLHNSYKKKKIFLSTGMATLKEIEEALKVIAFGLLNKKSISKQNFEKAFKSKAGQILLKKYVTLLHCTSSYPAKFKDINLQAINTLSNTFNLNVGYSDHSRGILVPLLASNMGITVLEKHFTKSRKLAGPDHKASLEPRELVEMVNNIRSIPLISGKAKKFATKSEQNVKKVARRSIVASKDIKKGDIFNAYNIGVKRPEGGKSPMSYWNILGKKSKKNYNKDDFI